MEELVLVSTNWYSEKNQFLKENMLNFSLLGSFLNKARFWMLCFLELLFICIHFYVVSHWYYTLYIDVNAIPSYLYNKIFACDLYLNLLCSNVKQGTFKECIK